MKMDGLLEGATRDRQSVTADWQPVGHQRIDGVEVVQIAPVTKRAGVLTEVFRPEWGGGTVGHVFQVLLMPGAIFGVARSPPHRRSTVRQ
jgi:hypothetical protein